MDHNKVDPVLGDALDKRVGALLNEAKFEIKHPVLIQTAVIGLIVLSVFNVFLSYQTWRQNRQVDNLTQQLNRIESLVQAQQSTQPEPVTQAKPASQIRHK